jgi:hypothetical protein
VNVSAYVRFRDRKGVFWNALSCSQGEEGTVFCGIDCDGGSFKLRPSGGALLLQNEGFVVVGGCGASEEEQEKPEYVRPGADDRVFRLEPRPIAECAAERDALRPAWAKLGRPLRVRFDKTEAVCFTRNYDAAFLAAHPQQMVRRAAVLKDHGVRTEDAGFPRFRLTFRVELRDGRKAERVAECAADNYALSCSVAGDPEVQEAFHLTRAREQGMMLRDRRGKLPKFFKARLGTDDRLFKLQADVPGGCDF